VAGIGAAVGLPKLIVSSRDLLATTCQMPRSVRKLSQAGADACRPKSKVIRDNVVSRRR
jgi:hypothetical protein